MKKRKIYKKETKKFGKGLILGGSVLGFAGISNATVPSFNINTAAGIPAKIAKSSNQYVMSVNVSNSFPIAVPFFTRISDDTGKLIRTISNCSEINCINDCGYTFKPGTSCNVYFMFNRNELGKFKTNLTIGAGSLYKTIPVATEVVDSAGKLEWKIFPSNKMNIVSIGSTEYYDYIFENKDKNKINFSAKLGSSDNNRGMSIDKISCNENYDNKVFDNFVPGKIYYVDSGSSCDIKLKYTPTEIGELNTFLVVKPESEDITSLDRNLKILAVEGNAQNQGLMFLNKHPVPSTPEFTLKKIYVGTRMRVHYKVYNVSDNNIKINSVKLNPEGLANVNTDKRVENSCYAGKYLRPHGMCNIFTEYTPASPENVNWSVDINYNDNKELKSEEVNIEAIEGLKFEKINVAESGIDSSFEDITDIAAGYKRIFILGRKAGDDSPELHEFYRNGDDWEYRLHAGIVTDEYTRLKIAGNKKLEANNNEIIAIIGNRRDYINIGKIVDNDIKWKKVHIGNDVTDITSFNINEEGNIIAEVFKNTKKEMLQEWCLNSFDSIANQEKWKCYSLSDNSDLFHFPELEGSLLRASARGSNIVFGGNNEIFYRWGWSPSPYYDSDKYVALSKARIFRDDSGSLSLSSANHWYAGGGFSYGGGNSINGYAYNDYLSGDMFDLTNDRNIDKNELAYLDETNGSSRDMNQTRSLHVGILDEDNDFLWDTYNLRDVFGHIVNKRGSYKNNLLFLEKVKFIKDKILTVGGYRAASSGIAGLALGLLGSDNSYDTWLIFDVNSFFDNNDLENIEFDKAGNNSRLYVSSGDYHDKSIKVAENLIPPENNEEK